MKILPVLVSAEYDETLKQQMYDNNQCQNLPSKLYVLSPRFYPVEFWMEPGGNGDVFITRQHFNTNDNWHKRKVLYVPGFCIIDLKPGESEEQFEIKYKANNDDDSEYQVMSYFSASDKRLVTHGDQPNCGVFFDLPSFQFEIKYGRLESKYLADTATAVLGSVNVGYTEIACFKKNIENPEIKCYLKVLPSSMTEQVFGRMVDDILAVHRLLLVSKSGKQSISLNKSWNSNLLEISEKLNKIENCFKLIQKKYYTRLKLTRCRIDKRSIRKFDDKLIMQFALEPSKRKYKAEKLFEDNNIYEHRMLLWALNGLSGFISTVSRFVEEKSQIEKERFRYEKSFFLKQYNLKRLEDADRLIQALESYNHGIIFDSFIECNYSVLEENDRKQELNRGSISYHNFCICAEELIEGFGPVELTSCCEFEGMFFSLSYNCEYRNDNGKRDLTLKFISNDVRWQELVYIEFNKIYFKKDSHIHSGNLQECLLKINGEYKYIHDEKREVYVFYSIECFSINNKEVRPVNTFEEAKAHLKRLYGHVYETKDNIKTHDGKAEKQAFKYLASELKAEKRKFSKTNQVIDNDSLNEVLNKRIQKLKQYSFLDNLTENGNETWTLTQKFINDPNYKAAYNIFHDLNENYHFTEINSSYSLIHQKVNDLYEYWIFIKILEVLMLKQKWELIEVDGRRSKDIPKDISVIVSKILSIQKNALQSCELVFSHTLGHGRKNAMLSFAYNRDINFVRRIGKSDHLTPDYHFVVTFEGPDKKTVKKHFCLDAKYRNYKDQKGKWSEDINKVCIEKYMLKLNESLKQTCINADNDEEYVAAFIVHSDANSSPYWGGDFRKFLDIEKITDGSKYPNHKVGSFPLLPNSNLDDGTIKDIERNLLTFFTMIFEYHCGLYEVCWECGNAEPRILDSSSGDSIHYLCDECSRFWVKYHCGKSKDHTLVKHKYNYHKESSLNSHFLVMCPKCGDEYEK